MELWLDPSLRWSMPSVTPRGGMDVPDVPLAPVGCFYSYDAWANPNYGLMHPSAFRSAERAGVFEMARKGPRGGQWFAVKSAEGWLAWVTKYKARVEMREMHEVAKRLGYDPRVRRAR